MKTLLKRMVDWYAQLDDVPQYLLSIPVTMILFFGTALLLIRGCGYIVGVPQKFAAQEKFIATLDSPPNSQETSRSAVNGGGDRSYLYVGYQSADLPETIFSFYNHALLNQGWKKLAPKEPDEKRWCKKDDLFTVRPYGQNIPEKGFAVSIKWEFLKKRPTECYSDVYGVGEGNE